MTLREFYTLYPIAYDKNDVDRQIKELPKPKTIKGKEVPENLNKISIGKLIGIQTAMKMAREVDCIREIASILLDVEITLDDRAETVFGFAMWVFREVEKINKMFNTARHKPTEEEIQAGFYDLDFGAFGILDWWCLRMGVTNHEEAENTPWARIYKCMEIDTAKAEYERRLRKIHANKSKR